MANTDVLVITGGAGGMGLACACKLWQIGATCCLSTLTMRNSQKRGPCSAHKERVSTHCNAT